MLWTTAAGRAAAGIVLAVDVVAIAVDNTTGLPRPEVFGAGIDRFMHAYTAFSATLCAAVFLWSRLLTGKRVHPFLIVASFGLALGAVWKSASGATTRSCMGDR